MKSNSNVDSFWLVDARVKSYQIVEVLADLPNHSGEGGPEQLLNIIRPRAVPVVRLQVVNPLKHTQTRITTCFCTDVTCGGLDAPPYADGGVADVDGVVGL